MTFKELKELLLAIPAPDDAKVIIQVEYEENGNECLVRTDDWKVSLVYEANNLKGSTLYFAGRDDT